MARYTGLDAYLRKHTHLKGRKPRVGIIASGIGKNFTSHETFSSDVTTFDSLIAQGGAPVITRSVPRLGGLGTISEMSFSVPNQGLFSDIFATYPNPENNEVVAWLYFDDGTAILDAERMQLFQGEIAQFPSIDYERVVFPLNSKDIRFDKIIGTLLTDSDAADTAAGLPQNSHGKIKPRIYGDHRTYKGNDSKALDTVAAKFNGTPCVHLGVDSDNNHRWQVSEHRLSEVDVSSDQEQFWAYDSDLERMVRITGITVVQNTSSGCIIKHANNPTLIDYFYGRGTATTAKSGAGVTNFSNKANVLDKDFSTVSTAVMDNVVSSVSIGDYTNVTVLFPAWENQGLDDGDISGVDLFYYGKLTYANGAADSDIKIQMEHINDGDTDQTTKPSTGSYPDARIINDSSHIPATKAGIAGAAAVELEAITNFSGTEQVTMDLYQIYKQVKYTKGKLLTPYFAGQGRRYEGTWVDGRTQTEAHFDNGNGDGGANTSIENGAGIVETILEDHLGIAEAARVLASFNTASNDLSFSKISFAITEQISSDDLLDDLLKMLGAVLYYDWDDLVVMKVFNAHDRFSTSDEEGPSGDDIFNFVPVGTFKVTASKNDKIDFCEGGEILTATLTAGNYTGTTLAAEVETQLESAGGDNYTVSYSESTNKFTLANDSGNWVILWYSGSNKGASAGPLLGFDGDSLGSGTDKLDSGDATSDGQTEGDSVAGWTAVGNTVLASDTFDVADDKAIRAAKGAYFMKVTNTSGTSYCHQSFVTVDTTRYYFRATVWKSQAHDTACRIDIGIDPGSDEVAVSSGITTEEEWLVDHEGFIAATTAYYINLYTSSDSGALYYDDIKVIDMATASYTSDVAVYEDYLVELPIMKQGGFSAGKSDNEIFTDITIKYDLNLQTGEFQSKVNDTETDYHAESIIMPPVEHRYTRDADTANHALYFMLSRLSRRPLIAKVKSKLNAAGLERWDHVNIRHPVLNGMLGSAEETTRWIALNEIINLNDMTISAECEEV